jgi:hypothetical protein
LLQAKHRAGQAQAQAAACFVFVCVRAAVELVMQEGVCQPLLRSRSKLLQCSSAACDAVLVTAGTTSTIVVTYSDFAAS